MKKICLFLLFSYSIFAQNNLNIEYNYTDLNGYTTPSSLVIIDNEAVFRILDSRESGVSKEEYNGQLYYINNDELSTFTFSNNDLAYVRTIYRKNELIYTHTNNDLNWNITGNFKKIGDYKCNEALLTLHGRKYKVWFTTEIPITYGPLKLNGLPGLIIEVLVDGGNFCKIKLNNIKKAQSENEIFLFGKEYFIEKKKKVKSFNEYEKFATEIMIRRKLKLLTIASTWESGSSVSFDHDQKFFTKFLIDIPENAINELQKIN